MKKIKKILGMLLLVLTLTVPVTIISEATTVETQAATTKVDMPKLVSAKSYGTSKIKFTWKRVSGVNGYAIYRKTDKSSWKRIKTITNNRTSSYTDTKLNPGTRYFYSIRAYKRVGQKNIYGRYNTKGVWAVTGIPKIEITYMYLYEPLDAVHILWSDYNYASGFEVYRKRHNDVVWKKIGTETGEFRAYYDKSVQDGITYDYKVRAYSKYSGKVYRGPFSNVYSFTVRPDVKSGFERIKKFMQDNCSRNPYGQLVFRTDVNDDSYGILCDASSNEFEFFYQSSYREPDNDFIGEYMHITFSSHDDYMKGVITHSYANYSYGSFETKGYIEPNKYTGEKLDFQILKNEMFSGGSYMLPYNVKKMSNNIVEKMLHGIDKYVLVDMNLRLSDIGFNNY